MLTKPRHILAIALAASALGATPAVAPAADPFDSRGEHAASLSDTAPGFDHRSPDAREPGTAQPVVVEVYDPVSVGFDWTAAIIGLGARLAVAVLAGLGVTGSRRRPSTV